MTPTRISWSTHPSPLQGTVYGTRLLSIEFKSTFGQLLFIWKYVCGRQFTSHTVSTLCQFVAWPSLSWIKGKEIHHFLMNPLRLLLPKCCRMWSRWGITAWRMVITYIEQPRWYREETKRRIKLITLHSSYEFLHTFCPNNSLRQLFTLRLFVYRKLRSGILVLRSPTVQWKQLAWFTLRTCARVCAKGPRRWGTLFTRTVVAIGLSDTPKQTRLKNPITDHSSLGSG